MDTMRVAGSHGDLAHISSALVQVTAEMPTTAQSPLLAADTLEAQLHYCFFGLAKSERDDLVMLAQAMRRWHTLWSALELRHRVLQEEFRAVQAQAQRQAIRLAAHQRRRWWRFWR